VDIRMETMEARTKIKKKVTAPYFSPVPYCNGVHNTASTFYSYMQSAVLAMIDSVRLSVRPSVDHSVVSCQNDSSYDHGVSLEDSPMTSFLMLNFTAKFQR